MRPKGISAELEQRRRDAIAMLKQGMKPTLVAKTLQTPLVSVGRWRKACRVEALKVKPEPGRPLKLSRAKRRRIGGLASERADSSRFFDRALAARPRRRVIESHFGVSYHSSRVWRILLALGWSYQKPEIRARERNEEAIPRWRRVDWPRIKKRGETQTKRAVPG
jgi:transposase